MPTAAQQKLANQIARIRVQRAKRLTAKAKKPKAKKPKKHNYNTDPLYSPAQQLSGANLRKAALDLSALEFRPQEQALARRSQDVNTQGAALSGRASDYYIQLAREEQGNLDRIKALQGLTSSQLNEAGQASQSTLSGIADQAQRLADQDSAVRGRGLQAGADLVGQEVASQRGLATRDLQQAQAQAAATTQGYGQFAGLAGQAISARGAETQQMLLNNLARQQTGIADERATLAAQRGSATTKNLTTLRQSAFENLATEQGLGIKQADLQAQVNQQQATAKLRTRQQKEVERQNRARNKLTKKQIAAVKRGQTISARTQRRGQNISSSTQRRGQNMSAAQRAADRAARQRIAATRRSTSRGGGRAGSGGMSAAAIKQRTNIDAAVVQIGNDRKLSPHRNERGPYLVNVLVKRGLDPLSAQAAVEIARYGVLRPATQSRLRRAGIRIPRDWKPRRQKRPTGPFGTGHL
jgi:hypothetical protein